MQCTYSGMYILVILVYMIVGGTLHGNWTSVVLYFKTCKFSNRTTLVVFLPYVTVWFTTVCYTSFIFWPASLLSGVNPSRPSAQERGLLLQT